MARRLGADADGQLRPPPTSAASPSRISATHGGGRIVNVASRAAYRGDSPQHWHYAASKAAMIGMTKTIARGYAAEDILAFAVAPGFTVSEMTEEYLAGPRRRADRRRHPARPGRHAPTRSPRRSAGWRSTRPPSSTGIGDRRQWRQLCSLACARCSPLRRASRSPSRSASRRARSSSRARRSRAPGPQWAAACERLGRLGQARAAGPHPRQHLSGRHLRHFRRS